MKRIFLLSILLMIFFGANAQQYVMTSEGYFIEGQIKKASGYVTLRTYLRDGNELLDSIVMDKKGRFSFRGHTEKAVPALLTINGLKSYRIYLEPSMKMEIEINPKKDKIEIKGSPLTTKWYSIIDPENIEDATVYTSRLENWALNNPKNIFSPDIMSSYLAYQWSYKQLQDHLNVLGGEATNTYHYKHLREREQELEKISVGKATPSIVLKDTANKQVSLKNFIRQQKYTLIDFWASWCKECRDNTPQMIAIYDNYKNKGFNIYSISLDKSIREWKQALREDSIKWTSVSDLKMWDGQTVKDYMIKSIPANVLVNQKGEIIAQNLDLEQLNTTLDDLINNVSYNIAGNIDGIKEGVVELQLLLENGKKEKYSSRIRNGNFSFTGKVDKTCMAMLNLPVKDGTISFFMNNDNINITGDKKHLENVNIRGSKVQDDFMNIVNSCNSNSSPMQCLMNYVANNPSSIYSPFIISNILYPYMSDKDKEEAINSLNGEATTMFQYYLLKEQQNAVIAATDMQTNKAKDFTLMSLNGEDVNLYNNIMFNNYTLVTFWASWDNMSRNKNIDYLRLYNNYKKGNNFAIISVSLDNSLTQWENAVKQDGIGKWDNVSDLKGWSSSVVRLYDLQSIPSNMLLDKEGNIVGKDLSLDEITRIITK